MLSLPQLSVYLQALHVGRQAFACLGNHDLWHCDPETLQRFSAEAGMSLLVNASACLTRGGAQLPIVGITSAWAGTPDLQQAYHGIAQSQPALTLMHEPDYFDVIRQERRLLCQFSGHTHGGQCRVPVINFAPVRVKYGKRYIDGHFHPTPSQQVYVSSGVGTTGMRVRFGCRPEIVLHTLHQA